MSIFITGPNQHAKSSGLKQKQSIMLVAAKTLLSFSELGMYSS